MAQAAAWHRRFSATNGTLDAGAWKAGRDRLRGRLSTLRGPSVPANSDAGGIVGDQGGKSGWWQVTGGWCETLDDQPPATVQRATLVTISHNNSVPRARFSGEILSSFPCARLSPSRTKMGTP